jgi:hypothetical protein
MDETLYREIVGFVGNSLWGALPFWAGLFTLILIFFLYFQAIETLDLSSFQKLYYPLFVALLLMFGNIIPTVLDTLLSPTVMVTEALVGDSSEQVQQLLETKEQLVQKHEEEKIREQQAEEEGQSFVGKIFNKIIETVTELLDFFENLAEQIPGVAESSFIFLLECFYIAARKIFLFVAYFNRIIIIVLLPLVIGLSIIPALRHLLVDWIKRYVIFYLYVPICNVLGIIINKVSLFSLKTDIARLQENPESYNRDSLAENIVYVGFLVLGIVGFFFIPTIAKWGVNAVLDTMSGKSTFNTIKEAISLRKYLIERRFNLKTEEKFLKRKLPTLRFFNTSDMSELRHLSYSKTEKLYLNKVIDTGHIKNFKINIWNNKYDELKKGNITLGYGDMNDLLLKNRESKEIRKFFQNVNYLEKLYKHDVSDKYAIMFLKKKNNRDLYLKVMQQRYMLINSGVKALESNEISKTELVNELRKINKSFTKAKKLE